MSLNRRTLLASGTGALEEMFAECGIDTSSEIHAIALQAYLDAWEPNTHTDPLAAPLLVGLGVRELSMGAPAIPLVKEALRQVEIEEARSLAHDALACASGEEVRALLRGRAGGPR